MTRKLHRTTGNPRVHRTTAVPTHVPSSTGPHALRGMGIRRADSDSDAGDERDDDKDKNKKDGDDDSDEKTERIATPPVYTGDEDS